MCQVTFDRYGIYLAVSNLCAGPNSTRPGQAVVYAFDKDVVYGLRALRNVPYWDASQGLGELGASIVAVMPARPQGNGEGNRDAAFFVAQVGAVDRGCLKRSVTGRGVEGS